MDNEKRILPNKRSTFSKKMGRVIIFPKDYTKQDYNGIAAILHAGVQTVCRGSCKSCKFKRPCSDAMTVASYVAKMAHYPGCEITDEEKQYIANDVLVVKEALEIMFAEGHTKLTI